MDGVWLILDSLSFNATPLSDGGPATMPNYHSLVEAKGVNFTQAYAPGPFSPSSHASFFTGKLPSETGMYEANPRFDGSIPTIGSVLSETHSTHLITTNHFLFQGLDEGFDYTDDIGRRYMVFQGASDPKDYTEMYNDDPRWKRCLDFVWDDGKPIRSMINGFNYITGSDQWIRPKSWGDEESFQYANTMCDMIRRRLSGEDPSFVVANFMDLHGPFGISDEALDRYFPETPHDELPIGERTRRDKLRGEKSYDPKKMYGLYKAAIWDFDRKFSSLVEELIADEIFVAVFADHGWYDTNTAYSDERLHVPLTLFTPDEPAREVDHTVSLMSLPRTTAEQLQGTDGGFSGPSLFNIDANQTAIAEIIHKPNDVYDKTTRIYVNRPVDTPDPNTLQHDIVLFRDEAKVQFIAGECETVRGPTNIVSDLVNRGEKLRSHQIKYADGTAEGYDDQTEKRLKRLGYLE